MCVRCGATALFEASMDEMPQERQFHSENYRADSVNMGGVGHNNRDTNRYDDQRSINRDTGRYSKNDGMCV